MEQFTWLKSLGMSLLAFLFRKHFGQNKPKLVHKLIFASPNPASADCLKRNGIIGLDSTVSSIYIKLQNNGNQTIGEEDFKEPLRLLLGEGSSILGVSLDSAHPYLQRHAEFDCEISTLKPVMFKPKEALHIHLEVENWNNEIAIECTLRNGDLKTIDEMARINRLDSLLRPIAAAMLLFAMPFIGIIVWKTHTRPAAIMLNRGINGDIETYTPLTQDEYDKELNDSVRRTVDTIYGSFGNTEP